MRGFALCLLLAASGCRAAQPASDRGVAHTPAGEVKLSGRVVDDAGIISASTEQQLADRSAALEKDTTDQLVVVTLRSLRGAQIEQVGLALGRGWGVGRRNVDNGVILLVAPNDRKVRIDVGYGLEGLLKDERAGRIVRDMLPLFRANKPDQAIVLGETEMINVLESDKRRPQRLLNRKRV
jgi:uncharacterized protein